MEELLNKLIEKGWKPRGLETKGFDGEMYYAETFEYYSNGTMLFDGIEYSLRELVSKESGLWQFVCENRMTKKMGKKPRGIWINSWSKSAYEKCPVFTMEKAEYRIIESALCDEDKLEKFLLDNIKVKG